MAVDLVVTISTFMSGAKQKEMFEIEGRLFILDPSVRLSMGGGGDTLIFS